MIDNARAVATLFVDQLLSDRLGTAGDVPGLREAAIALAAAAMETDDFEQLIRNQGQQLRHPSSTAVPDAYLADDGVAENALQRAAAGIRLAMAQAGQIVDARSFERRAASRLSDDPRLAVRGEMARIPRPLTRPQPLRWSIPPAPWASDPRDDTMWPPPGLDAVVDLRSLPGGSAALARVEDGPRAGWTQIGLFERHSTPPHRHPDRPGRHVVIAVGLEISDTEPPEGSLPFTSLPWQVWTMPLQQVDETLSPQMATTTLTTRSLPVVGLAEDPRSTTGLGEPPSLLVPGLPLIVALDLHPTPGTCGFSLNDRAGPALVGRLWRGHLVHDGNYEPTFPAVEGCDLLLRADLFEQLRDTVRESRMRAGVSVSYRAGRESPDISN